MSELKIPSFATEAEEREWWDAHEGEVQQDFVEAVERGEGTSLAEALRQYKELPGSPVVLDPEDARRAELQAKRKGMRYQAYLKMLVHEALIDQEKKAG